MRKSWKWFHLISKGRMYQSSQFKKRTAAVIQVTALLLLQVYALLPGLGHFVAPVSHGAVCRGDHRLCGCPVERIANRTCCCFKSSAMAMGMMEHHQMNSMPGPDMNRLARFVCPPCGSQPDFVSVSLEKIKFLRFEAISEEPHFLWVFNLSESGNTFQTRSNEPPDPPPEFITA
jgi:hypothetical protein